MYYNTFSPYTSTAFGMNPGMKSVNPGMKLLNPGMKLDTDLDLLRKEILSALTVVGLLYRDYC